MKQELRKLLKPPFRFEKNVGLILTLSEGYFINSTGLKIIDDFIATALNNQWERDFHMEEPLDKRHPHIHCPQCQYPIYKSDFDTDEDGKKKRAQGEKSINDYFVEQAKAFLTDAQYNSIYMLATQEKMTAEETI